MGVPAKKKQQQGERSRESILDATERLMATKGYAATSISDIRDACGLSTQLYLLALRLQRGRAGRHDGARRAALLCRDTHLG